MARPSGRFGFGWAVHRVGGGVDFVHRFARLSLGDRLDGAQRCNHLTKSGVNRGSGVPQSDPRGTAGAKQVADVENYITQQIDTRVQGWLDVHRNRCPQQRGSVVDQAV